MSELKARKFLVYDPIFKQPIHVFLNCSEEQWGRWIKKLNVVNDTGLDPNFVGFSTHISAEGEPNNYVIWLNHFDWTLDCQETLIHEIAHTIVRIWETNNIQFVPETQEFYAHSLGRLYAIISAKVLRVGEK